jgi:F5/8 type C domain
MRTWFEAKKAASSGSWSHSATKRVAALALASLTFGCAAEGLEGADMRADEEAVELATTEQELDTTVKVGVLNVAQGKVATQSSTDYGGLAGRAVDGNTSGVFSQGSVTSTLSQNNPWWSVDLGQSRFVLSVDIFNRSDCCTERLNGAIVELLDASGKLLATKNVPASTSFQSISFLPGLNARSVRIRKTGSAILSLAEVRVMAPATQPSGPEDMCWMQTYGRGVGQIPSACANGQQKDGLLCYPLCAAGYTGVGPVCWQTCPAGYTDDGAFCRLPGSIISANTSSCPWYDACGLTLARGCSRCPAGYANDGCTCRRDPYSFAKASYGRTAGTPMICPAGQQMDAGLCYPSCASGYKGVGPVCWGECKGDYPVACGAGCAKSSDACATAVIKQVTAPVEAAANIASLVLTMGGSAAARVPLKLAMQAAAKEALKESMKSALKNTLSQLAPQLLPTEIQQYANDAANKLVGAEELFSSEGGASLDIGALAESMDPTGLVAVGYAFAKPVCN